MQVIRNRKIDSNAWRQPPDSVALAGVDPVPADDSVVVSLTRLLEESEALLRQDRPLGVLATPSDDVRKLTGALQKIIAFCNLVQQDITVELAREALDHLFGADRHGRA